MLFDDFSAFFSDIQLYRIRPGRLLSLFRNLSGMSTRQFARETGLSQTDVVLCESGERVFPGKKIFKFNSWLELNYTYRPKSTRTVFLTSEPVKNESIGYSFLESITRENFLRKFSSDDSILQSLKSAVWALFTEDNENKIFNLSHKHLNLITWYVNIIKAEDVFKNDSVIQNKDYFYKAWDTISHLPWPSSKEFSYRMPFTTFLDFSMLMIYAYEFDFENASTRVTYYSDLKPEHPSVPISWISYNPSL